MLLLVSVMLLAADSTRARIQPRGDSAVLAAREQWIEDAGVARDPGWASDPQWRDYTIRYVRVYVRRRAGWQLLTHHSLGHTFGAPDTTPAVRPPAG